jgi:CheY-like chemotaxis protein
MMPGMDGYGATAVIRDPVSSVRRHDIPIIALTGNAAKQDVERCLAAGMDDHLPKPLILEDLLAVLEIWLSPAHLVSKVNIIDVGKQNLDRLKRLTVLYVEDDDETRLQYSPFLSHMVGTLVTAQNGEEGLAAYHLHHPDIIITDIKMPVMDGLEMMKQVRTLDTSLPAIVLSAFEMYDDQHDLGILRHEMKPVTGTKLKIALMECVKSLAL